MSVKMKITVWLLATAGFIASSYFTYGLMFLLFQSIALAVIMTIIFNVAEITLLIVYIRLKDETPAAYVAMIFCAVLAIVSIFAGTLSYQANDKKIEYAGHTLNNYYQDLAFQDSLRLQGLEIARKQSEKGYVITSGKTLQAFLAMPVQSQSLDLKTIEAAGVNASFINIAETFKFNPGTFRFFLNLFLNFIVECVLLFFTYLGETSLKILGAKNFSREKKNISPGENDSEKKKVSPGETKKFKKFFESVNGGNGLTSENNGAVLNVSPGDELSESEISELRKKCKYSGKSDPVILALWQKGYQNKSEIGRLTGKILKRKRVSPSYVHKVIKESTAGNGGNN